MSARLVPASSGLRASWRLSICPGQHYVTAPLAQGLLGCLRRSFQLEVLLLADLRADGFRAERRLHHEIVPQPIEKRACIINKLTPVNRGRSIFAVTDFLFNKLTRGNPRLTCSTLLGVTCHCYSRRAAPHPLGGTSSHLYGPVVLTTNVPHMPLPDWVLIRSTFQAAG